MVRDFILVLFAATAGFTVSGITANVYRLLGRTPEAVTARAGYIAVMAVAGPSVLFDHAARAWLKKSCSTTAFWLAAAIAGYWGLAVGLVVLSVAVVV